MNFLLYNCTDVKLFLWFQKAQGLCPAQASNDIIPNDMHTLGVAC